MKPKSFMLIAGEASGDLLAAELVAALRQEVLEIEGVPTDDLQPLHTPLAPEFFGAGGPRMRAAGVDLAFDLTRHSVIGPSDALKGYFKFRGLFRQLFKLAVERLPDVIIGVDYGAFNLRFARAIKRHIRKHHKEFVPWNPKLVQYVSPQVWASRPGRAYQLAANHDLLLSIFPFEKDWYARRVPGLRVEFVGHPMVERFASRDLQFSGGQAAVTPTGDRQPQILLLPGSRVDELRRHLPVMLGALKLIHAALPSTCAKIVLPTDTLAQQAKSLGVPVQVQMQVGDLPAALAQADLAIAKSGTVTLECAFFGVPTVVLYKTSWPTYIAAKTIVNVGHLAMPNLLAGEELFPEFIQHAATPHNIAGAAIELLRDESRRLSVKTKLEQVVKSLGQPGAARRAARAILTLLQPAR